MKKFRAILLDEAGSELVEFAISATVLFTAIFAVIEFSLSMYAYHFVTSAAQAGARFAIVRGADWTTQCSTSAPPSFSMTYSCIASATDVQNYVKSLTTAGLDPARLTVSTAWPGTTPDCTKNCSICAPTNNQGCLVQVKVSYAFAFAVPFVPKSTPTFTGTSEKTIQQ